MLSLVLLLLQPSLRRAIQTPRQIKLHSKKKRDRSETVGVVWGKALAARAAVGLSLRCEKTSETGGAVGGIKTQFTSVRVIMIFFFLLPLASKHLTQRARRRCALTFLKEPWLAINEILADWVFKAPEVLWKPAELRYLLSFTDRRWSVVQKK